MNYEIFNECAIGTVRVLTCSNGLLRFVKCSDNLWLVEFSMINCSAFPYSRFTASLTAIEASNLFDTYAK